MADLFAILFLLALCGVFFVLPVWFLYKHHKKTMVETKKARKAYDELPDDVKAENKRQGMINLARIAGIVVGVLVGTRVFGNIIAGVILGAIFAAIFQFVAESLTGKS